MLRAKVLELVEDLHARAAYAERALDDVEQEVQSAKPRTDGYGEVNVAWLRSRLDKARERGAVFGREPRLR